MVPLRLADLGSLRELARFSQVRGLVLALAGRRLILAIPVVVHHVVSSCAAATGGGGIGSVGGGIGSVGGGFGTGVGCGTGGGIGCGSGLGSGELVIGNPADAGLTP
jgi:hypothetical protein